MGKAFEILNKWKFILILQANYFSINKIINYDESV